MFKMRIPRDVYKKLRKFQEITQIRAEDKDIIAKNVAEYARDVIVKHMETQDLSWAPLSKDYLERKSALGLDMRTWIATSWMKDHLTTVHEGEGRYSVGVPRDIVYKDTGIPVNEIMRIVEYGRHDETLPPRPIFRPSISEVRKSLRSLRKNSRLKKYLLRNSHIQ